MNKETFVDIPGYEGVYQINQNQEIKRLPRLVDNRWGNKSRLKEKILHPYQHNTGYIYIQLDKSWKLHRLMAITFIPNPNNYPMINHKDGNKLNNDISNLEWCTNQQNMQHAFDTGLKIGLRGDKNPQSKKRGKLSPLYGMTGGKNMAAKMVLDTQTGIFYDCAKDAMIAKGYKSLGTLRHRLNGVLKNNTGLIYV